MSNWRTVAAVVTSASLLSLSLPAYADCTKDTDCKGDRVCEAGKCVAPKEAGAPPAKKAPPSETATAPAGDIGTYEGEDGPATAPKAAPPTQEADAADDENTGHTQRVIGFGVMITGGACAIIGTAVGGSAHKKDTQVAGWAFAGSGVAGGLIGLGIYLLAPKPKAEASASTLKLDVGLNRVGLGGTF